MKGRDVSVIAQDASVFDAIKAMADKGIGALLVIGAGKPVGMVTERDYARKIVLLGKSSNTTRVCDIMTSPVLCVGPEQSVEHCMALMTERRVRHLPVMEGDDLVGLISIGDLVKAIIAEQKFIIEQLEQYIAG